MKNLNNTSPRRDRRGNGSGRSGFTLIETALTTIIVGLVFTSMLQLIAAGTSANIDGANQTTSLNLAKSVREMSLNKTFAEVLAMDGAVHQPAIDSRGEALASFSDWRQTIEVRSVDIDQLKLNTVDPESDAVRVTVRVAHNGTAVGQMSWYRFRPTG